MFVQDKCSLGAFKKLFFYSIEMRSPTQLLKDTEFIFTAMSPYNKLAELSIK